MRGRWTRRWGYLLITLLPFVWISYAITTSPDEMHRGSYDLPLAFMLGFLVFVDVGWLLLSIALIQTGR